MRFFAPDPSRVSQWAVERAYLAGMEGIPWRRRVDWRDGALTLTRELPDSGNLYIPWDVAEFGQLVVSTASLREREEPYHLPLELARGTLNRVRNQSADWSQAGMELTTVFQKHLTRATKLFVDAATQYLEAPDRAAELAEQSMTASYRAIEKLAANYAEQSLHYRRQQNVRLATLLAATLNDIPSEAAGERFAAAFNSAVIPLSWRDIEKNAGEFVWDRYDKLIEWCHTRGIRTCGGPLLRLDAGCLPDWLYLYEGDAEQITNCAMQFVRAAATRYAGKMHVWHAAARLNSSDELSLDEGKRLELGVRAIDVLRQADQQAPVVLSFDQPWAEYLADEDLDYTPMHFADALVRTDLGAGGIGIEINLGYWPGTLPRDLLEISRQIDRWSLLGLPLLVLLTAPSRASGPKNGHPQAVRASQELVRDLLPVLLAKSYVHGIVWNQLRDDSPAGMPHGGLFGDDDTCKELLDDLTELRRDNLS
ncbi:MAG: hypothetical protein QF805_18285 [Pirellulaceae bacterium]|nr:hypothetical protein [Pirellulaceae bacterium]